MSFNRYSLTINLKGKINIFLLINMERLWFWNASLSEWNNSVILFPYSSAQDFHLSDKYFITITSSPYYSPQHAYYIP